MEAKTAALFGLQLALGELQSAAGPDQRLTARSDLIAATIDSTGAVIPMSGADLWTGVWDNTGAIPTLERWLVSAPEAAITNVTSSSEAKDLLAALGSEVATMVSMRGSLPAVEAGLLPAALSENMDDVSCAWVVLDEGIKVRINTEEAPKPSGTDTSSPSFTQLPPAALDLIAGASFDNARLTPENLSRINGRDEINFLAYKTDEADNWFHDITISSSGVLANASDGGLKKDLSRGLGDQWLTAGLAGTNVLPGNPSPFPLRWDVLRSWSRIYKVLKDRTTSQPSIDPRNTVPSQSASSLLPDSSNPSHRAEFDDDGRLELLDFNEGLLRIGSTKTDNWLANLDHHPVAPVVQQFIWRFGRTNFHFDQLTSPKFIDEWFFDPSGGSSWADPFKDGIESFIVNLGRKPWGSVLGEGLQRYVNERRSILSPLVVLWNPYNVTLDASNYRVSLNPAMDYQLVLKSFETGNSSTPTDEMLNWLGVTAASPEWKHPTAAEDFFSYWQASGSLGYSDNFSLELFGEYNRNADGETLSNSDQTRLYPGEMKIFSLYFKPDLSIGTWHGLSQNEGGFGGWDDPAQPIQLIGPDSALGIPWTNFRSTVQSKQTWEGNAISGTSESIPFPFYWKEEAIELNFRDAFDAAYEADDFRLTLTLSDAASTDNPNTGYVLRDAFAVGPSGGLNVFDQANQYWNWGSTGGSSTGPFLMMDVNNVIKFRNDDNSRATADLLYAANMGVQLKSPESAPGIPLLAHFNPLAWHSRPYQGSSSHIWETTLTDATNWSAFRSNNDALEAGIARWGNSYAATGQDRVILKEIPREPLWSIGQFMNAEIGVVDTAPLYPVGGSYAPPFGATTSKDYLTTTAVDNDGTNLEAIDLAWYFNDALFDAYFFSTIPDVGQQIDLPPYRTFDADFVINGNALANPRMRFLPEDTPVADFIAEIHDFDKAAAGLLVDGAFNVNSTSVPAWKVLLGSCYARETVRSRSFISNDDAGSEIGLDVADSPIPRFINPMGGTVNADDSSNADAWRGFRSLNSQELDALATAVVDEVKLRGPFSSIADFVNRRLTSDRTGQSGALQAALDRTVNDPSRFGGTPTAADSDLWGVTGSAGNLAPAASAGAPGWLLQNDIIQALAPILAVRSDTFTIRSYGRADNPLTGARNAEVWLEATVQRMPQWIEDTDLAHNAPSDSLNVNFGRRFRIVSLRWLKADEV